MPVLRLFAGLCIVAGLAFGLENGMAAVPDAPDSAAAATPSAAPTAAAPTAPAPDTTTTISTPERAPAPKRTTARRARPKPPPQPPQPATWDLSNFFANAAAQWRAQMQAAPMRGTTQAAMPVTMPFYSMMSPVPRMVVPYPSNYRAGTIVISTAERRLYYVLGDGTAIRYGIGVGRPGFTWSGVRHVTMKREWPDWTPPSQMLRRRPDLPRHMKGGIENPLGARAMYLGDTLYRIHGSNEPDTIGTAVSSGCFRLTNDDVIDLYERVKVGTMVVIKQN
jgi:lipoprotein-anchoring transpeptidase ErfK/SrfK